jgi:arsenate reductase
MSIVFYGYPRCGTCRNAQKWLAAHGVPYEARDLVADPIPAETLRNLWQRSGLPLRSFFNTSGESYRDGGFKDRLPSMSDDEALAALAADGKLVKRPILDRGDRVLVGFREETYASVF